MSLRDRFPPRKDPPGRLTKAVDLEPVPRKKKDPRSELPRENRKRAAPRRERQFAEQAARCAQSRCGCCGLTPEAAEKRGRRIVAHHWPTRAAGGVDRDTMPLCDGLPDPDTGARACHQAFHDEAGSPEAFLASHGCDVLKAIEAMRRKPDHDCEAFAIERVDVRKERSVYVCQRCLRELPDEQDA